MRPGIAALAARTGLPVIPVATDSGRYWGRRAFRKTPGVIRIVVGPPIPPGLPQAALIAAIQQRWREAGLSGDSVDKPVHKDGKAPGAWPA